MEISKKDKEKVLDIISRTMRLQENAKPGETYHADYSGCVNGVNIWKHVKDKDAELGMRVIYNETAYLGADYGTPMSKLDKILKKEEKAHDLI